MGEIGRGRERIKGRNYKGHRKGRGRGREVEAVESGWRGSKRVMEEEEREAGRDSN